MRDPLTKISTRKTPQSQRADERQVLNSAGGYVFAADERTQLRRFLTLGTTGGTFYVSEKALTESNANMVINFAKNDPTYLVREIVRISTEGRAPRQNPAIFALAVAASIGSQGTRRGALDTLPLVVRTGYQMFLFARYIEQFRGWGPALRRAVANWYVNNPADKLAYQAVKYRQREGWTHRDLLRLSHPSADLPEKAALFNWISGRDGKGAPELIGWFEAAQRGTHTQDWVSIIEQANGITWEMLPDAALNEPAVWEALIYKRIPQTALIKQLPRLTKLGVITQTNATGFAVATQLKSVELLKKGRVHPINLLVAQRTYASGHGVRGSMTWTPVPRITDALDAAFYASYGAVEPCGKRVMLALDVSGSMTMGLCAGAPVSPREASAAVALVTAATEPVNMITAFSSEGTTRRAAYYANVDAISPLNISPRQRLDDVINAVSGLPFGGTDCSLPMSWAQRNHMDFDLFVIYTDGETWAGAQHPYQALQAYRDQSGINARCVLVNMEATAFTIANPDDPGMLDIAGFDSAVPNLISDFGRGQV